jgi:hypothetical protein
MTNEKCYFKLIIRTQSPEGMAFLKRFPLNLKQCEFYCSGYQGYNHDCQNFITQGDVNMGGLSRLIKSDEKM